MNESSLFTTSPFSLVASETSSACWAGRAELKARLYSLCRSWMRRPDSTLDLMWANLGAGKTHALLHIRHVLGALQPTGGAEPLIVFVELPQDLKGFLDLYALIARAMPIEELMGIAWKEQKNVSTNLQRAARAYLADGVAARETVQDWILARRPHLRDLRATTGIGARIETDAEAAQTLIELLSIAASTGRRVILLLDEFQRIAQLSTKARETVLSHIRSVVSRSPTYLSIVLAVGTRVEKTALQLIPPELKTLMGMRPNIVLPALGREEAAEFMRARLAWFRPIDYAGEPLAPFPSELFESTLDFVAAKAQVNLTPRLLLQTFGTVADAIEDSVDGTLSQSSLREILESGRWEE
jgi:hypothetical protein